MATSTDLRSAIEEVQQSLPADQAAAEGLSPAAEHGALDRLARRVGALPWWVVSATIHAVVFLLIGLLAVAAPPVNVDEVIISTEIVKQKEPDYDPLKKRDIFKNTKEVVADSKVENPVVTHEKMEESDHFETDNNMDKNSARGQENAISDIPLGGTGTVGSMGVGGGGLAGCFGFRDGGGRKKAVGRFGGSEATESAVEAALRWLARHQDPQGFWSYADHEGLDKYENIAKYNVAMTGLAMLAFLGAGYTSKEGKHRDTLRRAEKWLVAQQGEDGHWAEFMYTQGIATLATVEAYGMVQDPVLKKAAQKGVDAILKAQRPYEAWDYSPVAKTTPAGGQNDTSVSSWQMQALKSARLAGLKVDGNAFLGMTNWLDAGQQLRPEQSGSKYGHMAYRGTLQSPRGGGLALLGVAAMCRMYLGQERTHPGIERPIEFISGGHLPKWPGQAGSGQNYYYWYYGTLACFQYGAEPWKKWNADMSKMLIEHQCRGGLGKCKCADKNDDGSWPPEQEIDIRAGRVFTTALSAMILEVYYRYLPIYREGK